MAQRAMFRWLVFFWITGAALGWGGTASVSSAAPLAAPGLSVSPNSGQAGTAVTLTGSGYTQGVGTILWDGATAGTLKITPSGFSVPFTVPGSASPGQHTLTVCWGSPCQTGEFAQSASAAFTVVAPTPVAPSTTAPVAPPQILSFTLDAPSIPASSCTQARWQTQNAKSATLSGEFGTITVSLSGEWQLCPPQTTSYTLRAFGFEGASPAEASAQVTLMVNEPTPTFTPVPPTPTFTRVRPTPTFTRVPPTPTFTPTPPAVLPLLPTLPPAVLPPLSPLYLALRCNPPLEATVIDFDDLPMGSQVGGQYASLGLGVNLSAPGLGLVTVAPALGAYSAPAALKHDASNEPEFGSYRQAVTIYFDSPQNYAGMLVGLDEATERPVAATLTGFDSSGRVVATDSTELGPGPTPITTCMAVRPPDGEAAPQISWLTLSYDSVAGEVIDHLFFQQTFAPEPAPSSDVLVEIRTPHDGDVLTGTVFDISGIVTSTAPLQYVNIDLYKLGGYSTVRQPMGRANIMRDSANPTRYLFFMRNIPLRSVANSPFTIDVQAFAADGGYDSDQVRVTSSFPPTPTPTATVVGVAGEFNLRVAAVEITQGVRGPIPVFDVGGLILSEPGVHVARRRTIVRVYPRLTVNPGGGPVSGLTARLIGTRAGAALPGSPLAPEPGSQLLTVDPAWTLEQMRGDATRSWNFLLPNEWVQAGVINLTIEVNPPGPFARGECAGCNFDNFNYLTDIRFVPTEQIVFYPYIIRNHPDASGNPTTPTLGEIIDAFAWLQKVLPVADDGLVITTMRTANADDCSGGGPACDTQKTAGDMANALARSLGVTAGDRTLFPLLSSPASTRGCSGRAGVPWPVYWQGACGPTLAQETIHAGAGLNHAGNSHGEQAGGGFDPNYPNIDGALEANAYGFDTYAMQAFPPNADECGSNHRHDFMSYGDCNQWVSVYTWDKIATWLGRPEVRAYSPPVRHALVNVSFADIEQPRAPEDTLLITGQILPDGTVTVEPAFFLTLPAGSADGEGEGTYRFELRDPAGSVVFTRRFEPHQLTHAAIGTLAFVETLPALSGASQVVLLRGDTTLATLTRSPSAPQVRVLSPAPGAQWGNTGAVTLAWEASDADQDALIYRVEVSRDTGQSWEMVAQTTGNEFSLDLETLPAGGENWQLRVQASDGLRVGSATVGPLGIAPRPPQPFISQPLEGDTLPLGSAVVLRGQAADEIDGLLPEHALEWLVDGEVVWHGPEWLAFDLAAGSHVIALRAANSAGLVGQTQVTITLTQDGDYDGLPDEWETRHGLNPGDPADAARDSDGDAVLNLEEFRHGADPNSADSDGDGYSDRIEIAGGGDPADPNSIPGALHGVPGQPVPTIEGFLSATSTPSAAGLPIGGLLPTTLWPLVLLGVICLGALAGGIAIVLAFRRRRRPAPTSTGVQPLHRPQGQVLNAPTSPPAASARARLQATADQWHELQPSGVTLGRGSECEIVLTNKRISRRHATIRLESAGWAITDLGSSNGTFLNEARLEPNRAYRLTPGDQILLGGTGGERLVFVVE